MTAKYDNIGKTYNQTRKADPSLVQHFFEFLNVDDGATVLDIGCGTGNYTMALHKLGLKMIGIDPSETMLEVARAKEPGIDWQLGTAEDLPETKGLVDAVLASLTTHHWTDLSKGFANLYPVLKPGCRLVIFTSTPEQMDGYWVKHYFPQMMKNSGAIMPTWEATEIALKNAGFEMAVPPLPWFIPKTHEDLFLQAGKERPELYFDPVVQAGISSFSEHSLQQEVKDGLARLRADLDAGKWEAIVDQTDNSAGDYLFVIAEKPG